MVASVILLVGRQNPSRRPFLIADEADDDIGRRGGRWSKHNNDISPSDAPAHPPIAIRGPMTRARMRQLNLNVSSFS
jgi:hypothetical protein